mgnify:CR=1 FL=1
MPPSELLTKLLDDVVHRPEDIKFADVVKLSTGELAIYIECRDEQKSDPESKLAKYEKSKARTGPIKIKAEIKFLMLL